VLKFCRTPGPTAAKDVNSMFEKLQTGEKKSMMHKTAWNLQPSNLRLIYAVKSAIKQSRHIAFHSAKTLNTNNTLDTLDLHVVSLGYNIYYIYKHNVVTR